MAAIVSLVVVVKLDDHDPAGDCKVSIASALVAATRWRGRREGR